MINYLLISSLIIFLSIILMKISGKIGIPMLLAFIVLGMIFGADGLSIVDLSNYKTAGDICTIALIFIMFYGGFGTRWETAKPAAPKAIVLSSLGTVATAVTVGGFCHLALKMDLWESMLIGSVICSTDAASVFSILRSKRINLKYHTAPLLEVESGSNDPFSYMLTVVVLSIMSGTSSGPQQVVLMLIAQIAFGLIFGYIVALMADKVLKHIGENSASDILFVFSIAILSYAGAEILGGNGYLSAYVAGIVLGQKNIPNKVALVHFFDGVTALVQVLIFFLLGVVAVPSEIPTVAGKAIAIALFLTFIARPLVVFLLMTPFKAPFKQQAIISWCGIRGAASIVFAIIATAHPAYLSNDIFHIVFFIVLFSLLLQGSLLPWMSEKLDMIDDDSNVLKTFNDYSEEMPVEFIKIPISEGHDWIDKKVKEIAMIPNLLIVLINREEKKIIPDGDTDIRLGDELVISALAIDDHTMGMLTELEVEGDNQWIGKRLADIKFKEGNIIVLIKRGSQILIPNGDTVIQKRDLLVFSSVN